MGGYTHARTRLAGYVPPPGPRDPVSLPARGERCGFRSRLGLRPRWSGACRESGGISEAGCGRGLGEVGAVLTVSPVSCAGVGIPPGRRNGSAPPASESSQPGRGAPPPRHPRSPLFPDYVDGGGSLVVAAGDTGPGREFLAASVPSLLI